MRSPVRTLFGKILLWSVSVQLITTATVLGLVTYYLPESQKAVDNAFSLYADTAVALYEHFGPRALDDFLARSGENTLLQLQFSAADGTRDCGPASEDSTSILAKGQGGTYCLTVHAASGELPDGPEDREMRLQITVLLQLIGCAALSYVIARYLSRPIADLRLAAHRLARGDLTARAGGSLLGRRDEAADLVREFDQMAERVAALIEAQGRLVSDVSHEIKSPLARLSMALGLARRQAEAHAPKQFERMQREIDAISQLVRELLTLASLDAARRPDETVDLAAVVADVVADMAYEAPERADDLFFPPPAGPMQARGDSTLLARAFANLLRNAVFYTVRGERVTVGCESFGDGWIRLSVADEGPGVPGAALERLFDPFYRVDDARTRQTGGTGIGLAICRRAVELHGGRVFARNRAPRGLSVVIELPQS